MILPDPFAGWTKREKRDFWFSLFFTVIGCIALFTILIITAP
ncbi:hypothetical protein [Prevotella communis]|nr:hypothetical protein [Prevotella communis]